MPLRLAHLSDVHVSARPLGWGWRDWFGKRVTGWLNTHCGRRRRAFRDAEQVLALLADDLRTRRPDAVVFSGDATMLGFPRELARVAQALRVEELPGLAVPGNHDYYTPRAAASGCFEQVFTAWQQGLRCDGAVYPFARQIEGVWLVGVSSSVGHHIPWDATGFVDPAQLGRLERLLPQLVGPRILVTHYPVAGADGRPETPWHRLRNLDDLLAVARKGQVALWLHGHRHEAYCLDDPRIAPFPVICTGSATQAGLAGYNEYTIEGAELRALRRRFDPQRRSFRDAESFAVRLGGAAP